MIFLREKMRYFRKACLTNCDEIQVVTLEVWCTNLLWDILPFYVEKFVNFSY